MITLKIHTSFDGKKVLAVCDSSLLGNTFEEGKLQLDCSSDFYKGEETSPDDVLAEVGVGETHLNVVGEESVALCISQEWISEDDVKKIDGIPYAQIVVLKA